MDTGSASDQRGAQTDNDGGDAETESALEDPAVRNHPRYEQMFPSLSNAEIDKLRRFGNVSSHSKGELLYKAGSMHPGVFVLLSGRVRIVSRDGLNRTRAFHTYTQGEFTSDITQLSNTPAIFDAHVIEHVQAVLLRPDGLRALVIGDAELGEKIMRALILRRALVAERGDSVVFVGPAGNARLVALSNLLRRISFPYTVLDAHHNPEVLALLDRLTLQAGDFPLVLCPNGAMLRNPNERELASCLGLAQDFDVSKVYDVLIVGAGPAGLAAAVYAASEGLSVAALDCRSPGGQAGTSARIENYLGFPNAISGQDLAGRAHIQAQKFGARIAIPYEVKRLYCERRPFSLELSDGQRILSLTVVIASGAEYRRPDVGGLERFEGKGVYYWATPIEARLCSEGPVLLVGGGNSAGQAAVFLAPQVDHIHMFVRGANLEQRMSRYLAERVASLPNITLHYRTELTALEGGDRLERVRYRGAGGIDGSMTARHLFAFVGATPNTRWLETCGVEVDTHGFVLTGVDLSTEVDRSLPLQTSITGVFAVGDVRSGSSKRVASAVGEGSAVIAQIHTYLSTTVHA
ncbi:FAD-dependent oxidoreductase [Paraburkholderia sp. SIMBA_054]|uniref:FAD-dependent oxidoreductase n=1 Tax=Paraburkholderia sp. SIMBA_054 TaxID=3085795 RepID=UPI00397931DF